MIGTAVALVLFAAPPEADAAAVPAPRVTPHVRRTLQTDHLKLVPHADGSYSYRDRQAGFAALIHPDGRVTFRGIVPVSFDRVRLLGFDIITGRTTESDDERHNSVSNTLVHRGAQSDAKNDPLVDWGPYGKPPILLSAGAKIGGLADLARASVRTRAQRDFMITTAKLREQLAIDTHRTHERAAIIRLGDELRATWSNRALTPAQRRERLFQRWDECDELDTITTNPTPDDTARRNAAVIARRVIEAFIRRVAPPGSPDAFTPAELQALNATRTSNARFDPYAAVTTAK